MNHVNMLKSDFEKGKTNPLLMTHKVLYADKLDVNKKEIAASCDRSVLLENHKRISKHRFEVISFGRFAREVLSTILAFFMTFFPMCQLKFYKTRTLFAELRIR